MSVHGARAILLVIAAATSLGQDNLLADTTDYEEAVDLSAADILPVELLSGEHHRVVGTVRNDGYLNYYVIQSDYGEFPAASTAMLRMRLREIGALAQLDELSHSEVFIEAAADAGINQLEAVEQLVTHPIATIKGIPSGIGRMFKRYSRQSEDAVADAKEYMAKQKEDEETTESDDLDYTREAVKLTERYFGVSDAERNWAKRLGTDPYTSNEVLVKAIKNVAWADRLGRMALRAAGGTIPGIGYVKAVNEAVWGEDPYELRDRNRALLAATGADDATIDAYLKSPWMSPTQQTLLTAAIGELDGVEGRDGILKQALNPVSEAEVGYYVRSVALLAWHHRNRRPFDALSTELAIPGGIARDGTVVLMFPSDHVYWTQAMAEAAEVYRGLDTNASGHALELWILGTVSNRARRELESLGYELHVDFAAMLQSPSD